MAKGARARPDPRESDGEGNEVQPGEEEVGVQGGPRVWVRIDDSIVFT
jgi:hypothetical protein